MNVRNASEHQRAHCVSVRPAPVNCKRAWRAAKVLTPDLRIIGIIRVHTEITVPFEARDKSYKITFCFPPLVILGIVKY